MHNQKKYAYIWSILIVGLCTTITSFAQNTPVDKAWPREIKTKKALVVVYQPQVETLTDVNLDARTAIAVTPKGDEKPLFGAVWFTSQIATDRDTRLVSLTHIRVTSIKFPGVNEEDKQSLIKVLEREIPKWTISLSLDRLITSLDYNPENDTREQYNNQAPEIIFSEAPAILVVIDGDPIYKDLTDGPGYLEIINTPFFLVSDAAKKTFYLHGGDTWYTAQRLTDSWEVTKNVPYVLENLIQNAEKGKGGNEATDAIKEVSGPVHIFLRDHPAELIQSKGKPEFSPVEHTNLLYMTNTEDDILMDISRDRKSVV